MPGTGAIYPTDRLRRSFVYRVLEENGASFAEINGAAVAMTLGAVADELEAARTMAIADLSPLPRVGLKGPGALGWTRRQGVAVPASNNGACRQPRGGLAARLADTEILLVDNLDGAGGLPHHIEAEWTAGSPPGTYLVNRQGANFWFVVSGIHAHAMFAKLCAVDIRPAKFPPSSVAQTPVARTNCIIIRDDLGDVPAYHLLGDITAAEYQRGSLIDALAEFAGRPVGLETLRRLGSASTPS
jgi:sarcosine oxidase subunit gamma